MLHYVKELSTGNESEIARQIVAAEFMARYGKNADIALKLIEQGVAWKEGGYEFRATKKTA